MLFSSIFVVTVRNPIYAILFFILVVLNLAVSFILLSAEFLAFSFLVVYVGAICIVFLFIVLMLELRSIELGGSILNYFSLCGIVLLFLVFGLFSSLRYVEPIVCSMLQLFEDGNWLLVVNGGYSLESLAQVLYLDFFPVVLVSAFILLLEMVSSIVLTMEYRSLVVSPKVDQQVLRVSKIILKDNVAGI